MQTGNVLYMDDILAYIPQRPPFVMVDELVAVDESTGTTRFQVRENNIFVEYGRLTEPAMIENIAQTAAAGIGYIFAGRNEPPPVGFIGAVQNLEIMALPEVGQTLQTSIAIKNQILNVTLISGKIQHENEVLAQCEMKIFIQSSDESTQL